MNEIRAIVNLTMALFCHYRVKTHLIIMHYALNYVTLHP